MRKTKEITLTDRGSEKTFKITEMSATAFEWWIIRAGRALASTGIANIANVDSAQDVQELLANALIKDGLRSLGNIKLEDVKPLYDELLQCCELKSGNFYTRLDPATVDSQIEDVKTLFILRKEAFTLHVDFLAGGESLPLTEEQASRSTEQQKPKILVR